jgi:3-oxoadipate enol-lactonase
MPFSNGKVRIHYEISGDGPAVVLIHANPFDRRLWMYQVARWSSFYRIVAVDIRGYGRSDKPETPFSLADMAEDVLDVCRAEGIDRAIFAGVSVGSGMALLIALDHPKLAQAVILVGGSSKGNPSSMQRHIEGFLSLDVPRYQRRMLAECVAPGFGDTDHGRWLLGLFADKAHLLSGRSIARIMEARMACNMQPRLNELRVPLLVVNGEHDASLAGGKETAGLVPGAEHVVIKGAGHCCNIEEPAAFDRAVIPFLAKHRLWRGPI